MYVDPHCKFQLIIMAQAWLRLAEQADKNAMFAAMPPDGTGEPK